MVEQHTAPLSVKIISGIVLAMIATVIGYLMVYWWVFGGFENVLNVSLLKNQIISRQTADDVKSQLIELGYEFEEEDFFQLNQASSSNYTASSLGGYVPVKKEEASEEAFYIRGKKDENGNPGITTFFVLDDQGKIDQDSMTTLISE